jgi:hypothetical protein
VFVSLGVLSTRQLGVARELPSLWLSLGKIVFPPSVWGLIVENQIDHGGRSERFRDERNPVLFGHLNEEVGIFMLLNIRNKYYVLCAQIASYSKVMFMFLPS